MHFAGNPCVVDHHIESAETVNSNLHEGVDVLGNGDINVLKRGPCSRLAGKLLTVVVIEVRDDHFGAGIHEPLDYSTTETRRTAGDDGNFSG